MIRMYPRLLVSILLLGCVSASDISTKRLLFNKGEFEKQSQKYSETESFSPSASDQFAPFKYFVTVDPVSAKATDNDTCMISPHDERHSSGFCKSLDHALQIYRGISSVVIFLAAPTATYHLNFTYNVMKQQNIWFYGNSSLSPAIPTIKCSENVGLSFRNSSNISISNIEFINCGSVQNSTSSVSKNVFLIIKVGLYFYNCTDISMREVRVINGSQAIGVVMYDTNGKVEISNSTFAKNSVQKHGNDFGGGGFAVEFTYCKPGDNTCSNEYDPLYKRNMNSTYTFDNCIFLENQAVQNHSFNFKVPRTYNQDATGQGGGLSIHIKGDAKNNSFILSNSQFIKNNATWGGGLHIEIDNKTTKNSIKISGCNFSNNSAATVRDLESKYHDRYAGGGAIDIIATPHDHSTLHIRDCRFTYNQAFEGGAVYFSIGRQTDFDQLFDVVIADSLFESNQARLGSAMVLTNFPVHPSGFLPEIHIYDCTFLRNSYSNGTYPYHPGGRAAVYVSQIPVSFQNSVTFSNNFGSALVAVGTILNFTDTLIANFSENFSNYDGGAIALLGDATIIVGRNTSMIFMGNNASHFGGAIYNRDISEEQLKSTADCFLRYSDPFLDPINWTAHFNFSGNKAHMGGCSIFTTSLFPCIWNSRSNPSEVFHWNSEILEL